MRSLGPSTGSVLLRCIVIFALAHGALWAVSAQAQEIVSRSLTDPSDPIGGEARGATTTRSVADRVAPAMTLHAVLDDLAGVDRRATGGYGAPIVLSIRGAEPRHTRVTLDGIALETAYADAFDLGRLAPDLVDRATLYRSLVPLIHGPAPPGGVLALATDPARAPFVAADLTVGSHGAHRLALGVGRVRRERHRLSLVWRGARNAFRYFDDARTPLDTTDDGERRRQNAGFEEGALGYRLRASAPRGRWDLTLLGTGARRGVPGATGAEALHTRLDEGHALLGARWSQDAPSRTGVGWDIALSHAVGARRFEDPRGEFSARSASRTRDVATHSRVALQPQLRVGARLVARTVGAVAITSWNAVDRGETQVVRQQLYAGTEWGLAPGYRWFDPVVSVAVVQASDRGTRTGSGGTRDGVAPNRVVEGEAQAGFTMTLAQRLRTRWTLTPTAARTHHLPSLEARFGTGAAVIGNPALRPETRIGGDVTQRLAWRAPDIDLQLLQSAYAREARDLVVYVEAANGVRTPENVARAGLRGLEHELDARLWDALRLRAGWAWARARDLTPGGASAPLPQRPRHSGFGEVRFERPTWAWSTRVDADGERTTTRSAASLTPTRIELGASLRWAPAFGRGVALSVEATNLLDARTDDVALRDGGAQVQVPRAIADFTGFPLPGRQVFVSLAYRPVPDLDRVSHAAP